MRLLFVVCALGLVAGCATAPTKPAGPPPPQRQLTPAEKTALAQIFSQGLKDPGAAQFKWMPVIMTQRDGITDYCGLVNGKNSYGGYTGYVHFYAQLTADDKGQYTSGRVRAIEEPNREINPLDPRWLNGVCEQYGYADFTQAQP